MKTLVTWNVSLLALIPWYFNSPISLLPDGEHRNSVFIQNASYTIGEHRFSCLYVCIYVCMSFYATMLRAI